MPADAAFVHIHAGDAMAEVTVRPGRSGAVTVTIQLQGENGTDLQAKGMTLAFDLNGARKITRAARRLADGTWSVDNLELTGSGVWTVRVIVNVDGAPSIELDAPIVIEP
jgi:copper transport protein